MVKLNLWSKLEYTPWNVANSGFTYLKMKEVLLVVIILLKIKVIKVVARARVYRILYSRVDFLQVTSGEKYY